MKGTIVALGGGGFSDPLERGSPIDDHLLALTGKDRPKVCFVPTASGDADSYCEKFLAAFDRRAEASVLSLFSTPAVGWCEPSVLLEQDLIYVGGGSTANLLAVWRVHGLPDLLSRAAASGTVLAGISAGMNCWFEGCSTDSFGPFAPLNDGLGFLSGAACPHYLGEPGRRERLLDWVGSGQLPTTYAVDDHTALVFRDGELVEAISEEPGHPAYRVERHGHGAVERELPVRVL